MNDHVGRLAEHGLGVVGYSHAPRRVSPLHDVAQVAAGFGRIRIDGSDNFDGFFFPHQAHDGGTDGADAVLHRTNFLFHSRLRCAHSAESNTAGVRAAIVQCQIGANTIKQSRGVFNDGFVTSMFRDPVTRALCLSQAC